AVLARAVRMRDRVGEDALGQGERHPVTGLGRGLHAFLSERRRRLMVAGCEHARSQKALLPAQDQAGAGLPPHGQPLRPQPARPAAVSPTISRALPSHALSTNTRNTSPIRSATARAIW